MDGIQLGLVDSLVMSLSGMAIVFFVLILLAIAIILMGKILDAMGLGSSAQAKKAEEAKKSAKPVSNVSTAVNSPKPVEEDFEEYAVILAAVSEHTRTPIENLKITSINRR
jgi:sodium pump decarboxylase, gamma subunit